MMTMFKTLSLLSVLCFCTIGLVSGQVFAAACLIESDDEQLPIRMCQQNITIPDSLFTDNFCQPNIPERTFKVDFVDQCPAGAYGICNGAQAEGVAYQQAIHYYSDPDDAPFLKAYCEQISSGSWETP